MVQAQAALDVQRNNEAVLRRQLQATQDRFNVGEVTRTDVSQAEASLASATAGRIEAEGTLRASRATFERIIGQPPGTLETLAVPAGLPASMQDAIQKAQANYPGIVAAVFTERAAADNIDLQFGALLPSIDGTGADPAAVFDGLPSVVERRGAVARRSGRDRGPADHPAVFPGQPGIAGCARPATPMASGGSRSNRSAARAIQSAVQSWQALVTARAAIKSFLAAVRAEELAVEGLQQEAQVGSRTVLDVLTEQQNLLDAQLSLVQARRNEVVAGYQLRNAVGTLTAQDMGLPVRVYDPEPDYQKTRACWWGTSIDE